MRARAQNFRDRNSAATGDIIDLQFDAYGYTHGSN
jgi:hypothetical protein